jgi:hypothetical protein
MMVLDTIELEADRIIHNKLHQHRRGKEGEDYGRGGRGRGPFIPGDALIMVMEIQSDLPWDDGIHQQPHHVSMAKAAIRSAFSSHTGLIAAGFLIQRKPGSTVTYCS